MRTRVGYAGGSSRNPTYRAIGDHSETIQIDYDPSVISYEDLLAEFWRGHNAAGRNWSRQYRSAVFFHDERQRRAAEESKRREGERIGKKVRTAVEPLERFYPAEDYHQKYSLRQHREILSELGLLLPTPEQLRDSTLAARLNGWLAGYGNPSAGEVSGELETLGAPASLRDLLLDTLSLR